MKMKNKYNLIISENPILKVAVAYFKPNNNTSVLSMNQSATQDDLNDKRYQFTSDEIESLKKNGNETFNQLIELGKVSVNEKRRTN